LKKWGIALQGVALGLGVLAVFVAVLYFLPLRNIGGMSASYRARDHDPLLAKTAATARPLIDALDRYWKGHQSYPEKAGQELIATLSENLSADEKKALETASDSVNAWSYFWESGNSYSLYHKLGWDPSLFYRCTAGTGKWEFDPGDGRPTKILQLNP
jgi:hypothetical protein